jgi:hypothetical protein
MFVVSAPSRAAEPSPVRLMMEKSGIIEQFSDFDQQMHDHVLASSRKEGVLPEEEAVALAKIVREAMNTERMFDDLEKVMSETLSPDQVSEFSAFYDSALGQRILKLEIAASRPDAEAEQEEREAEILTELRSRPDRLAIFRKVDDTLHTSELSTTIALTMMHSIAAGAAESRNRGGAEFMERLNNHIAGIREQTKRSIQDQIMVSFAYTYGDLPDDDLADYVEFLKTDTAQATYAAFSAGMHEIFQSSGHQIGTRFAEFVKQKKI